MIDVRGEQTIEVVAPANGLIYEALIQQVMLGEEGSSSRRTVFQQQSQPHHFVIVVSVNKTHRTLKVIGEHSHGWTNGWTKRNFF